MIPYIPIAELKRDVIDVRSIARQGKIDVLPLGSDSFYYTDKAVLVSRSYGTMICRPGTGAPSSFRVETFPIALKKKFRYDQMPYIDLELKKMAHQFAAHEVTEVLKRVRAVEDVVYAPTEEVSRLQKFFDDLNRPVAVLPSGKVIDLGDNFNLVVRTDICSEVYDDPLSLATTVVMWEDIGFFCDVN